MGREKTLKLLEGNVFMELILESTSKNDLNIIGKEKNINKLAHTLYFKSSVHQKVLKQS